MIRKGSILYRRRAAPKYLPKTARVLIVQRKHLRIKCATASENWTEFGSTHIVTFPEAARYYNRSGDYKNEAAADEKYIRQATAVLSMRNPLMINLKLKRK